MGLGSSIIFKRADLSAILERIGSASVLGIQIPNGLKFYAGDIADFFRKRGHEVIFSGRATYGACDIDMELLREVDFLIHFAHTEMVQVERVIYIPYLVDYSIDVELIKKSIPERNLTIIGTASYAWKFDETKRELERVGFRVELKKGAGVEYPGQVLGCNYSCLKNTTSDVILFIGDGRFHPLGASLCTRKKVYSYSPLSGDVEVVDSEEFLKKRYMAISGAFESESFGILVSSKIGQKRLELAKNIQKLAHDRGKRAEIILVDEITPSVIDNFRFDTFVNTACPRIAFDDYSKYYGKIISPEEFKIVIGVKDISEYSLDFET